jgi:hypothetical protein
VSKQTTSSRTEVGVLPSLSQEPRRKPWQPPSIEDSSVALTTSKFTSSPFELGTFSKSGS